MVQNTKAGTNVKDEGANNQIAKSELNIFRKDFSHYEKTIVKLLSNNGVRAEKFMTVVENSIRQIPKLLDCERPSLFASILTAAEYGLEPNTPAQLSWIIPYRDNHSGVTYAQFQLGYHGVVDLLYRNERIKKIVTELVYENDIFERYMDDSLDWKFRYVPKETDRGARRGVFCVIHIHGADPLFKYMSKDEIMEIKSKSKSPSTYDEKNDPQGWMWKKAVLKQNAKMAPKNYTNNVVANALNTDSMLEGGATITLDEKGQVKFEKRKNRSIKKEKLNIVFGSPEAQDAEIVDEK